MRSLPYLIFVLFLTNKTILASGQEKEEILTYNLEKVDTLVDIGCGNGASDYKIAHYYPDLYLVLEDLPYDSHHHDIKKHLFSFFKNSQFTPNLKNRFNFVFGTNDSIPLATSQYKMVLCRMAMHEFVNKEKMVNELERILSKDGILIIVEREPRIKGERDRYCKRQYLTTSEILTSFHSLKLLEENSVVYKKVKMNILKFTK